MGKMPLISFQNESKDMEAEGGADERCGRGD